MRHSWFHSLRHQHIALAIVLGTLMVCMAYMGYRNVAEVRQEAATHLSLRSELLSISVKIRNRLLEAYRSTDLFLLEPSQQNYKDEVFAALDRARELTKQLKTHPGIARLNQADTVAHIEGFLEELKMETALLFTVRVDTSRQYPSMAVSSKILRPNRIAVSNAMTVAFNELTNNQWLTRDPETYQAFVELRFLWTQMLSNFRLYLANRVGSFNVSALPTQENAVNTLYLGFQTQLVKLTALKENKRMGFESAMALEEIESASKKWYQGYKTVQIVHHSKEWRMDARILKQSIAPLVALTSDALSNLEDELSGTTEQDLKILGNAAKNQTYIVLMITLSGVAFIFLSIVLGQRLIFAPINKVARALKAVAFGKKGVMLPESNSRELRDLIEAFSEMREQVKHRQSDLEHQALHDALTSLPNRTLLKSRMEHDIHLARRENTKFTLLMIDLNRFKEVNDTLGHQIGDLLLIEVGARLSSQLRDIDTVARLGGDEFAILLPDTDANQAAHVSKKICHAMDAAFHINELQLYSATSIGIAEFPTHGKTVQELIQHADVAMYVAKQNQSGFSVYDPQNDDYSVSRLAIINDLRHSLNENKLHLQYQAQYDCRSGHIKACEALLRWEHPRFGTIPPDQIISLAEQTGLVSELSYWVLEQALKQHQEWRQAGLLLPIAINLSVFNLKDSDLVNKVSAHLRRYKIPKQHLTLEITESSMMANPHHAIETISKLKALDVRIAIDDFGTGFSSLAYLKQMPVDELKIDKSFIIDMNHDDNDEVIVHSTIELAHNLGLKVVGEGVESLNAWLLLRSFGCDTAQGFHLAKPLFAEELYALAQQREPVVDSPETIGVRAQQL